LFSSSGWDGAPQRCDLIRQSLDFLVLHARVPEQLRASALRLSSVRERHVGGLLASSTLLPTLPCMTMIVCCRSAQRVSLSSLMAKTYALVTISVRPGRTTWPRAISLCPSAGATRFSLYSTVRTEALAGTTVIAA